MKDPGPLGSAVGQAAINVKAGYLGQRFSGNGCDARNDPRTDRSTDEGVHSVVHGCSAAPTPNGRRFSPVARTRDRSTYPERAAGYGGCKRELDAVLAAAPRCE